MPARWRTALPYRVRAAGRFLLEIPAMHMPDNIADDLLDGAKEISDFTGIPERRIYAMSRPKKGKDGKTQPPQLPLFRLPGCSRLMARKSELRPLFSATASNLGAGDVQGS